MGGFTRQVQTKLTERSFYQLEDLALERGTTISEIVRDLIEEMLGRPRGLTLAERVMLEAVFETHSLVTALAVTQNGLDDDDKARLLLAAQDRGLKLAEARLRVRTDSAT